MTPQGDLLLEINNLTVSYQTDKRWIPAVHDFHLSLGRGQIYGLVGESGSGKSTIAMALMRYLSSNGRVEGGAKLQFAGEDLLSKSIDEMRPIWAKRIKLVPQNAGAALNPSIRIGAQVLEALKAAKDIDGAAANEAMMRMFHDVSLIDPENVARRYPHELSGGMQQRVMIAMALISDPELLILDEPTTGLDVTTEAVILDLIRQLIAERDTGVLYITHNLGVVAQLCERVVVLYAGEIMEDALVDDLFHQPTHPYTLGLLHSLPRPGQNKRDAMLHPIDGNPPSLFESSAVCVFAERCTFAVDLCHSTKPPLENLPDGRAVRCHRWQEIRDGDLQIVDAEEGKLAQSKEKGAGTLMRVTGLTKHFPVGREITDVLRGATPPPIRAVDGVDLTLDVGQTLGLVGESGSGKTTLARVIIGLQERSSGRLELLGMDIRNSVRERSHDVLAKIQKVFQNPQNALNPYLTVRDAIRRPLIKLRGMTTEEAEAEVLELLRSVNLREDYADRFPGELSGGEKQRVAIARAFASDPDVIICDEPVSALDVSVQAAVLNLLARLQNQNGTAYLFISHDLAAVGYLADTIAVMYLGQLFEVGSSEDLLHPPFHPYTEALFAAIPIADPRHRGAGTLLRESLPSAQYIPSGCRFHTRCPRVIGPICEQEEPPWRETGAGHVIRCHIPLEELLQAQAQSAAVAETD